MNYLMKKISLAFLTIAVLFAFASCSAHKQVNGIISFYAGNVTIQRAGGAIQPVKVQEHVKDGDIIITGANSYAIVQVDGEFTVRFEADTRVLISKITDKAFREFKLEKGKVLSRVEKLKKGSEYIVKTPTVVASVRGTEFLTEYIDGRSAVAVGKGKVIVAGIKTKDEKMVTPGNTAAVSDKMEIRATNQIEALELKKFEKTPAVNDAEKLKTDELYRLFEEMVKADEGINAEIERLSGMSFEDIKTKYNRIDYIRMYSGKVIKGVILSRGAFMKVLTPNGIISVNTKQVKKTGTL